MVDIAHTSDRQLLKEHRESFIAFETMVLFSAMHVGLTLACLALAFPGDSKGIAFLLWIGGTLAMLVGLFVRGVRRGT